MNFDDLSIDGARLSKIINNNNANWIKDINGWIPIRQMLECKKHSINYKEGDLLGFTTYIQNNKC